MSSNPEFDAAFARCPLIAILRGVKPGEVVAVGEALFDARFRLIEVPPNSPEPVESGAPSERSSRSSLLNELSTSKIPVWMLMPHDSLKL